MKHQFFYAKAFILSALNALFLSAVLLWVTILLSDQKQNQETLDSYYRYLSFNNQLESFIISHSNILYGFSAYINTFDELDDELIYEYLDNLLKDNSEYIRNVGILEDTTIHWNYPRENNSAAIGVDLTKIPAQAPRILKVKNQGIKTFQGPVNLVQGGIGYIIRIPIKVDDRYWGQASIVLDGDRFIQFMDKISAEAEIDALIQDSDSENQIMYGNPEILERNPTSFEMVTDFGVWEISFISLDKGKTPFFTSYSLVVLLGIFLILFVSLYLYNYLARIISIQNQNKSLSQTASTDRLTGIFNRAMLENYILQEMERADQLGYDLSLIFFDLDHFKRVNDTYGHVAGDRVLINTVEKAKEVIRKSDFFVRWGGEEFLLIMPGLNLNDAVRLAEKLRSEISQLEHEGVGVVTISLGIAERLPLELWGSWFKRADKALYLAKKNGRNRLSISLEAEPIKKNLKKLQWKDEWLSRNEVIDQEHRQLVDQANQMIDLVSKDQDEFIEAYDRFVEGLITHFRNEEAILRKVQFPFLEEHQKIHGHILGGVIRTKEKLDYYLSSPEILFEYILEEILVGHFLGEDFKYFNYLNS